MTFPGSRQTRAAREDLQAALDADTAHRRECVTCARARHHRRPADRCDEGAALVLAALAAKKHWRAEQEADRAPVPGQETLW